MASQDGRVSSRPYRKASEYRSRRQFGSDDVSSRTPQYKSVERENEMLRDRLESAERKLETMEVEYDQSREYFVEQLDVTKFKLREKSDSLTVMQRNYSELQAMLYELQEKNSKVFEIESERDQLFLESQRSKERIQELTQTIQKLKEDNEKLRNECKLAVSLLQCNQGDVKPQPTSQASARPGSYGQDQVRVDLSQYNEHVNPYMDESDNDESAYQNSGYEYNRAAPERKYGKPSVPAPQNPATSQVERTSPIFKKMPPSPNIAEPFKPSTINQSKRMISSPWERQDNSNTTSQPSQSSTPWVRDPSQVQPSRLNEVGYRYSSAEAYGATPVVYPKTIQQKITEKPIMTGQMKPKETRFIPARPSNKGTGENKDVYIADDDPPNMAGDSPYRHVTSSDSSKKSTPNKVATGVEKGSSAEKSSLLATDDDDDIVMTIEQDRSGTKFGIKSRYKRGSSEVEGRGLLGRDSDHEVEEKIVVLKETVQYETESDDHHREGKESEKMQEAVMREEMNLMTMVEVETPNSQKTDHDLNGLLLSNTEVTSQSMLAHIPPPNLEAIVSDSVISSAPPPPPMFMGDLAAMAPHPFPPPYNHPTPYSSSLPRLSQPFIMSQQARMMSQPISQMSQPIRGTSQYTMTSEPRPMQKRKETIVTSPSTALDDLTSMVKKEFESAQTPKKSTNLPQETGAIETPPSDENTARQPNVTTETSKDPIALPIPSKQSNDSDRVESVVSDDPNPNPALSNQTTELELEKAISTEARPLVEDSLNKEHINEIVGENIETETDRKSESAGSDQAENFESQNLDEGHQSPTALTGSPELLV